MSDRSPTEFPDLETLMARRSLLFDRIADAGGSPERVEILAVTKRFPVEAVGLAMAAGFRSVGENYAQELIEKAAAFSVLAESAATGSGHPVPAWHMIGGLQRNKVKKLAGVVSVFQTIDRIELALEVAKRAPETSVYVQVNTTSEDQKSGCAPASTGELVVACRAEGLEVSGLMTIGPTDGSDPTSAFEALRALADATGVPGLSMGMSSDLEAAIRCGSTMIRVGSALFGPRPTSL
jgi:pyridoxal phosphate enzyme (YggS family)